MGSIKEHLEDRVNTWIAKELWGKISTELDAKTISGELADEHVRFSWMLKRAKELVKEYFQHEKEAKD